MELSYEILSDIKKLTEKEYLDKYGVLPKYLLSALNSINRKQSK